MFPLGTDLNARCYELDTCFCWQLWVSLKSFVEDIVELASHRLPFLGDLSHSVKLWRNNILSIRIQCEFLTELCTS